MVSLLTCFLFQAAVARIFSQIRRLLCFFVWKLVSCFWCSVFMEVLFFSKAISFSLFSYLSALSFYIFARLLFTAGFLARVQSELHGYFYRLSIDSNSLLFPTLFSLPSPLYFLVFFFSPLINSHSESSAIAELENITLSKKAWIMVGKLLLVDQYSI